MLKSKKTHTDMKYAFLTKQFDHEDDGIYAIPEDKIETLRLSQTYDNFGQKAGTYNVGDSVELLTEKSVEIANKIAKEQDESYSFSIGSIISGYENPDVFDSIEEAFDKKGLRDGKDYNLYAEECKGFNYWDGHNWRTVITESDTAMANFQIISDDAEIERLNKAIEEMEYSEDVTGEKRYTSGDLMIVESFWAGDWESYKLSTIE